MRHKRALCFLQYTAHVQSWVASRRRYIPKHASRAVDRSGGAHARADSLLYGWSHRHCAIQGLRVSCSTRSASRVGWRAAGDTHPNTRPERSTAQNVPVDVAQREPHAQVRGFQTTANVLTACPERSAAREALLRLSSMSRAGCACRSNASRHPAGPRHTAARHKRWEIQS